jgi:hypothetical protein
MAMTPEEVWRRKSDQEVFAAVQSLSEYTEAAQKVILAEAARRRPMWICGGCIEPNEDEFDTCWKCGSSREGVPPSAASPKDVTPSDNEVPTFDEASAVPASNRSDAPLPAPRRLDGPDPAVLASLRYKVVPFNATVSSSQDAAHLASQIESIISSHAASGWEYVGVHQLQTFRAGSSGCFGLGATPPTSITTEFLVFRR